MAKLGNRKLSTWSMWERGVWELLVAYVNLPDGEIADTFAALLNAGMNWIGGRGLRQSGDLGDFARCADVEGIKRPEQLDTLARKYLPKIRTMLTWLSDPYQHRELANEAVDFLACGADIRMGWTGNTRYKPGERLLEEGPQACHSVLSPVCRFVKDQIDRYHRKEVPLWKAVPIALCDRPGCGRFRLVKLPRDSEHVFCSNLCKAKFHQAAKGKAANAEYMQGYRATLDRHKLKGTGTKKAVKRIATGKAR